MQVEQLTLGLVQECWVEDPIKHQANLADKVKDAACRGAKLVCLQELTLSPYFCTRVDVDACLYQEDLHQGPTAKFVAGLANTYGISITASLYEKAGYNTAVAFGPNGQLIGFTRKQHIPCGEKYHEDYYFKPGDSNYPVHDIQGVKVGLPTCYDQWFPELSRIYGLKQSDILVYPTAIGGEPTAPGFNSQPMWQKVMLAQGIMNNLFIVAVNRVGVEDDLRFYGSSFISSPMGEVLAQAPSHEPAVLVATIDFRDKVLWGRLFPFFQQRQPYTYHDLVSK